MNAVLSKTKWGVLTFFALGVSAYATIYFSFQPNIGVLNGKSPELIASYLYRTALYLHIGGGIIALSSGIFALMPFVRKRNWRLHRNLGKSYVLAILISGIAGGGIAWVSEGGLIGNLGFFCLAVTWLFTTYVAYRAIRNKDVQRHERWMLRSYAVTFAAVMLRLWLPILMDVWHLPLQETFAWLGWICWVPNLLVMEIYLRSQSSNRYLLKQESVTG